MSEDEKPEGEEKPEGAEGEEKKEGEDEDEEEPTFEEVFKKFAKFGDPESKDDRITLANIDKWLKQANIKKLNPTDTARAFKEVAKNKFALSPEEFDEFLENVTKGKELNAKQVKKALTNSGSPVSSPMWTPADALKLDRCKPFIPQPQLDRCGNPIVCVEKPDPSQKPPPKSTDKLADDKKPKDKEKEKGKEKEKEAEEPAAE